MANVEFVNMKEIEKNLLNSVKVMSKTVEEGLTEVGERGVGILKRNTPVYSGPDHTGGRLRQSMSYTINRKVKSPLSPKSQADVIGRVKTKDEVVIGTNVVYAAYVEYMANNGSQGYMNRSYKQLKPIAKKIMATVIGRKFK